eukprot:CAMPEP_0172482138 /NCGR_PEP_ID=MMETSP1066-20121228/8397_1 /TAXON_ID=671091 /ORGANISM="Coscinodiscus wailesii, Strain CCMP2513" /LENGTH=511 /DNA_ID=CAMNT_0013245037 /DNA_START=16 /DNA_END=1549 /DNA_ORIENTATION=-
MSDMHYNIEDPGPAMSEAPTDTVSVPTAMPGTSARGFEIDMYSVNDTTAYTVNQPPPLQPRHRLPCGQRVSKKCLILFSSFLALGGIVLGIGYAIGKNASVPTVVQQISPNITEVNDTNVELPDISGDLNDDEDDDPVPEIEATPTRYESIRNNISPLIDGQVLDEPNSPQSRALRWIVYDDDMQLDPKSDNLKQRYILSTFYFSTDTNSWSDDDGWIGDESECKWKGVTCNQFDAVSELKITANGISGVIPDEIGELQSLERLDLWQNAFTGPIPDTIGKLIFLKKLYLNDNQLTGSIPKSFGDLVALENMSLKNNMLSGVIPAEIENLKLLSRFIISNNDISGTIPTQIGEMSSLSVLMIENNQIYGTIPDEIENLGLLVDVRMEQNRLSGDLPDGLWTLDQLDDLYLDGNLFTGTISTKIAGLTKIGYLYLNDNKFDGTVPTEIATLQSLVSLTLHDNDIKGAIPDALCDSSVLEHLSADCTAQKLYVDALAVLIVNSFEFNINIKIQ